MSVTTVSQWCDVQPVLGLEDQICASLNVQRLDICMLLEMHNTASGLLIYAIQTPGQPVMDTLVLCHIDWLGCLRSLSAFRPVLCFFVNVRFFSSCDSPQHAVLVRWGQQLHRSMSGIQMSHHLRRCRILQDITPVCI